MEIVKIARIPVIVINANANANVNAKRRVASAVNIASAIKIRAVKITDC